MIPPTRAAGAVIAKTSLAGWPVEPDLDGPRPSRLDSVRGISSTGPDSLRPDHHHQATFEEFHATRLPWRWRHLVIAAQASAISYGKNMEVYEALRERVGSLRQDTAPTGRLSVSTYTYRPV